MLKCMHFSLHTGNLRATAHTHSPEPSIELPRLVEKLLAEEDENEEEEVVVVGSEEGKARCETDIGLG